MKYQKLIVVFTACISMCSNYCLTALHASAEEEKIKIEIDKKTVSMEELKAMQYQVPIFVNLTENAGINSAEFIISIDNRCNYEMITNSKEVYEITNDALLFTMTSSAKFDNNSCRFLWAAANITEDVGPMVLFMIQIPQDAVAGDVFGISYLPELSYRNYQFEHLWGNVGIEQKNYAEENSVAWSDGWIKIEGETSGSEIMSGDVDANGAVDILDVILINKAVLGKEILTETQLQAVDFNQNGVAEASESLAVMKFIVGLIDSFFD